MKPSEVDETKLNPEFIARKHQITSKPGARYVPAAFVTGAIAKIIKISNEKSC